MANKKLIAGGLVLAAVVVGIIFWMRGEPRESTESRSVPESQTTQPRVLEVKTNNEGGVTIAVTPKETAAGIFEFEIVLDTHSVELSYDLTKISVLRDENGQEYRPINWEGDPPGGHHREGTLIFNPIAPTPKSIELKITGIAEAVRIFTWQSNLPR